MATAIPRSAQAHGQATVSLRILGPTRHPRGHRAGVIHLHRGRIAEVTQHRAEAALPHRGAIHHPHAHPEAIHHLHAVQAGPRVVAAEAPVVVVAVAAEEEGAKTIT